MNPTALLAALSGAALIAGLWCVAAGLIGRVPNTAPTPPPSRWSRSAAAMTPGRLKAMLAALACGITALALTRWPVAGIAAGAAVACIPRIVTGRVAAQRIQRLEALEQWTRRLADLLAAGRGLEQAIEHSATRNVPAAIADPVAQLARRLIILRMPTEQALRLFADELDDPIADRIAAALILVARRRGTGASTVLGGLAELVARDVTDRREVEAARAEHRTTVRWVIGILLVLTTAAVFQRSYVAPFGTPTGQAVLGVVVTCYAGALWWLHRLGDPDESHRFLADPREFAKSAGFPGANLGRVTSDG